MVADRVVVRSRSGRPDGGAWLWQSDGRTGYEIEPAEKEGRGTEITLHLKEEEFADTWKIESIIRKYSNFVPFPIELGGKVVNTVQAVWTRSPKEVTDAEYEEFYKFACHDHEAPAYRLHFNSDAPLNLRALLFVPAKSMELMTLTREESAVGLYCRRVMITGKASGLLPEWLRFVRGVVDSEDLPLNISRETMQDSSLVRKLNDVLTKRFIKFLDEAAREDSERYANFYAEHGHCLREGAASDWQHKEALAKLLRFASTAVEAGKLTGFADYTGRMKEGQEDIYWMSAPTADSAKASPYFEAFDAKGWEVLVLTDPRDEFLMQNLGTVEGKKLVSVERAKLSLDPKDGEKLTETEGAELTQFVKTVLGSRVGEVRVSSRLVGSPAIVVEKEGGLSPQMRRMLKAMRRDDAMSDLEDPVADLELNPANPVIVGLHRMRETETALATQLAEQLLDQALVSANLLEDPRAMLQRMNALLERLVKR
jgi:molecular chaperone HtpG